MKNILILSLILNTLISLSTAKDWKKPYIHWPLDQSKTDIMENLEIRQYVKVDFSQDRIEGDYAALFNNEIKGARIGISRSPSKRDKSPLDFLNNAYSERSFSLWFKALAPSTNTDLEQSLFDFGIVTVGGASLYIKDTTLYGGFGQTDDFKSFEYNNLYELEKKDSFDAKGFIASKLETKEFVQLRTPFQIEKWNHTVLVFDKGKTSLYLNGKQMDQGTLKDVQAIPYLDIHAVFGSNMGSSIFYNRSDINHNTFNGLIDDIKIYNSALTENDVVSIYQDRLANKAVVPEHPLVASKTSKLSNPSSPLVNSVSGESKPEPTIAVSEFQPPPEYHSNNPQKSQTKLVVAGVLFGTTGIIIICVALLLYFSPAKKS